MKLDITPGFQEFCGLAKRGNIVIVSAEVSADLLTPVSAFINISTGSDHAFLLESVVGGERIARYTFLGVDPSGVFTSKGDEFTHLGVSGRGNPLDALKETFKKFKVVSSGPLPPFAGGAVGFFSYDIIRHIEEIPDSTRDDLHMPDIYLMLVDSALIFDHLRHKIQIVCCAHTDSGASLRSLYSAATLKIQSLYARLQTPLFLQQSVMSRLRKPSAVSFKSNMSREAFKKMVLAGKEYIRAGDVFQVVLSQRFSTPIASDPFDVYRVLRSLNPSPYMFFLKLGDITLVGSSPEILVTVRDREVVVRPIAGTRPRPADPSREAAVIKGLLADEKERAEHIMLVDLGRNDVGRVAVHGSVRVDDLMSIEKYSHVIHIVSNVTGKLKKGKTAIDTFKACFPAGTVSGAPKVRAMEIIDELEPSRRGHYAGATGYLSYTGHLDSCITIRTIAVRDGVAHVQAGGGIVADSVPEREYQESVNKARALMRAVEIAAGGIS